jgi:hypothetical protein
MAEEMDPFDKIRQELNANMEEVYRQANSTSPEVTPYGSNDDPNQETGEYTFLPNMGGLLFGTPSVMDEYMTPAQQKAIQSKAMMNAAMALLKAGRTTTTPISFGEAIADAYQAGTAGYQGAQQNAIAQILMKQKMDEVKAAQDQRQRLEQIFGVSAPAPVSGAPITAEQALGAPGMPVGPTNSRAAMIGQVPVGATPIPEDIRYEQYMRAAQMFASEPAKAKAYMDMAFAIKPRDEIVGQPFEVTDASGKPVMVNQFKSGKWQTVTGFGPKREVVLQNVDGKLVAIDKSKLTGGEVYGTGISPAERERLDLDKLQFGLAQERMGMERSRLNMERQRLNMSQQEFQRGQYERLENEDGVFYVPKIPGMPVIPVAGPDGIPLKGKAPPKPTEGETNAAGFAGQMENAEAIIKQLPSGSQPGAGSAVAGSVPFLGGVFERGVQSPQTQQYKQAADAWIRAKLRKESGAAIGKEEMQKEYETYFPQINDTPLVIEQKATSRQIATEAMKKSAGKSYQPLPPVETPPAPGGIAEGTKSLSKSGKPIIFKNGKWEYI